MCSVSIRPTRIHRVLIYKSIDMTPLSTHLQELRYRCGYVVLSMLLCVVAAWTSRYALLHLYVSHVTTTLYALDVGEEIRISVYFCIYIACLAVLPYMWYSYYSYVCAGMYIYEHRRYVYRSGVLALYILGVYMMCHTYVWPQVYGMLMETSFGVDKVWGIHVEYMPRLYSLLWWSAGIPAVGVVCSLVPVYVIHTYHAQDVRRYRRVWYMCSIVLASIVCPALPYVQLWCTLLLCLLYELTLVYLCVSYTRV